MREISNSKRHKIYCTKRGTSHLGNRATLPATCNRKRSCQSQQAISKSETRYNNVTCSKCSYTISSIGDELSKTVNKLLEQLQCQ